MAELDPPAATATNCCCCCDDDCCSGLYCRVLAFLGTMWPKVGRLATTYRFRLAGSSDDDDSSPPVDGIWSREERLGGFFITIYDANDDGGRICEEIHVFCK